MSQIPYRANLAAMAFPFLSEFSGRSVVIKQADQNYVAQVTSKEDLDKDIGVATLYYCHNVIATAQGYQSISYTPQVAWLSAATTNFSGIFSTLDSTVSRKAYIGYTTTGDFYYCSDPYYSWIYFGAYPALAGKTVTFAYVNGITYCYFANVGCYKFDFTSNTLVAVTLGGLVPSMVTGIVSVQGYMLAWSAQAIAWSSLIDPTDFVPSLVTGAGGGAVQGARGDIVCCVSHTIGLVVYTNQNAVAAPSSGNSRYPFNFRELVASGGLASGNLVTYDSNTGNHYVYTTSGLQLVSLQQTQTVIPELTDYLAGSVFEDFDETTNTFSVVELTAPLKKRLALISDRYLVFSCGITEYTHAIVYDLINKRWGKFKHTHVEVFEFNLIAAETVETPRRSIAFLDKTGAVSIVKIDTKDTGANGVMLLGKFQYIRNRLTTLETVEIENVPAGAAFSMDDWYSLDGKNALQKPGTIALTAGLFRKVVFHLTAINHSLLVKGAFNIVSLLLTFHNHGRR